MEFSLKHVDAESEKDVDFLYFMLAQRKEWQSISHKKMPSYRGHRRFVSSKPYAYWWLIQVDKEYIGHIYVTERYEIGIFLKERSIREGYGARAVKEVMDIFPDGTKFLANIAPMNKGSSDFFVRQGFTLIQKTYCLIKATDQTPDENPDDE